MPDVQPVRDLGEEMRPLADIANDLRRQVSVHLDDTSGVSEIQRNDTRRDAADVLDLLAKQLPQPVCDRGAECLDGKVFTKIAVNRDWVGGYAPCPDPHCDHGLLALDEHLRRVAECYAAYPIIGKGTHS